MHNLTPMIAQVYESVPPVQYHVSWAGLMLMVLVGAVVLGIPLVVTIVAVLRGQSFWRIVSWVIPGTLCVVFGIAVLATVFAFRSASHVEIDYVSNHPGQIELWQETRLIERHDVVRAVPERTRIAKTQTSESEIDISDGPDATTNESVPVVADEAVETEGIEPPGWVVRPPVDNGGPVRKVVSSGQFATVDEALDDALGTASQVATTFLFRDDPIRSDWIVPKDWIREHAILDRFDETANRDLGPVSQPMHRVHLMLGLSGDVGEKLALLKKDVVVTDRLWKLGGVFGFLTLLMGTVATYLRVDTATNGAYRGRLRLAAVSVLGAAGAAAAMLG